ncbi:MAG TPA: hypothetical protein VGN87_04760 [Paenibacillus sp.]
MFAVLRGWPFLDGSNFLRISGNPLRAQRIAQVVDLVAEQICLFTTCIETVLLHSVKDDAEMFFMLGFISGTDKEIIKIDTYKGEVAKDRVHHSAECWGRYLASLW